MAVVPSISDLSSEEEEMEDFLCDYEKQRLQNIKENQEMLKKLGLPVSRAAKNVAKKSKKSFSARNGSRHSSRMKQKRRREATYSSPASNEGSDSDSDWRPEMSPIHKKNNRRRKRSPALTIDIETRLEMLRAVDQEVDECLLRVMEEKSKGKPSKGRRGKSRVVPSHKGQAVSDSGTLPECFHSSDSEKEDFWGFPVDFAEQVACDGMYSIQYELEGKALSLFSEDVDEDFHGFTRSEIACTELPACNLTPHRRRPRRKAHDNKYQEPEIPDEDEYLFCDDCNTLHHGDCPVHGPLKPLDSTGQDQASLAHTSLPVPSPLTVKPSSIHGAGLGVFATQFIHKRVQVGPYEGQKVDKKDMGDLQNTAYAWEVRHDSEESYFIDGSDLTHSNWMRFVNCARNEDEQNMLAFQYQGHIYYRTFRNLYPGMELLVWYGDQYARDLGISTLREGMCATYQCLGCGATFVEERSLQLHLKHAPLCAQANPMTHTCGKCHHQFQQLEELQQHVKKHILHDKSDVFKTSSAHHPETDRSYKCKHSGKCFSDLQKHLWTHTGDKCEHCGKCFSQNSHLQGHLQTHTGDKPYKCEHCGKCFSVNGSLQQHLRTHTGDKPYKCEHCGKCFNVNSNLQQHLRTHTGDKPYKCEHCGKCFSQNSNLQQHLRTHTGDKPYKCEHCRKCFSQNSSLQKHLRTHTGDKPYKCEHCRKCFSQNSSLQKHLRTHTGDKPYKCEHCGKCFNVNSNLQKHLRTHTGDKPYKCEHCGKCFSESGNLQKHLRTHTGDKPYKCEHCGKGFSENGTLQRHLRTHTGDKP